MRGCGTHEGPDLLKLLFEASTATGETDDIDEHYQPGGKEAVKHESEVALVHNYSGGICETAKRIDLARGHFLPGADEHERRGDHQDGEEV